MVHCQGFSNLPPPPPSHTHTTLSLSDSVLGLGHDISLLWLIENKTKVCSVPFGDIAGPYTDIEKVNSVKF